MLAYHACPCPAITHSPRIVIARPLRGRTMPLLSWSTCVPSMAFNYMSIFRIVLGAAAVREDPVALSAAVARRAAATPGGRPSHAVPRHFSPGPLRPFHSGVALVAGQAAVALPGGPGGVRRRVARVPRVRRVGPVVQDHAPPLLALPAHFPPVCVSQFISGWRRRLVSSRVTKTFGIPFKTWIFPSCRGT